jgi:prophage regulatory protein
LSHFVVGFVVFCRRFVVSFVAFYHVFCPSRIDYIRRRSNFSEDTMSLEHSPAREHRASSDHQERLIGERECRERSGLSRAHRWRLERDGRFPRRVRLGPRTVRWRLSEILSWIAELPTASPGRSQRAASAGTPANSI